MGRNDDPDTMKYFVPDPLLTPMFRIVGTEQQPRLNGRNLRSDDLCLLGSQGDIGC